MSPVVSLPSFGEALASGLYYKWRIALAGATPVALALALAFLLQPQYRADSKVLIRAGREYVMQPEIPGGTVMPPQTTMQETIGNEVEIATSDDLLREVLDRIGIERLYPRLATVQDSRLPLSARALLAFQKDVKVVPVKLADVVDISVRNSDPALAVAALHELLRRFEERHTLAFRHDRSSLVNAQLQADRRRLTALERERATFQKENRLFSLPEQRLALIQQRARDADALLASEIDRASLDRQLALLRSDLALEPETVVLSSQSQESPAAPEAQQRVQALREQKEQLLVKHPEGSLFVAPVQAALTSAEHYAARVRSRASAITTGPNPIYQSLKAQVEQAKATLAPLDGKVDRLKAAVAADDDALGRLTEGEVRLLDLNHQIDRLVAAVTVLSQRLVDARYMEDLDRARLASLVVIEQPAAWPKAVFPNKLFFLVGGMVLGGATAALALLLCLTLGNRFLLLETVERVLMPAVAVRLPSPPYGSGKLLALGRRPAQIGQ